MSFVAISSLLCCFFNAMLLVGILPQQSLYYVEIQDFPQISVFIFLIFWVFFVYSKHHKSFDPFQEQKETSFKELQSSAESLAQFLCEAMETTSVNSGDGGGAIKSVFDTLLQVRKFVRKEVGNLICSLSDI